MAIARRVLLAASESRWLATRLPNYPFARRAVRRFMPGETFEDALRECAALSAAGISTVITRLGENIMQLDDAASVTQHYVTVLREIEQKGQSTNISIKLTQLGFDISHAHALDSVRTLMRRAGTDPVWIDMEGSRYTQSTIELFQRARESGPNVGLCVQAYLRRTQADLASLLQVTTAIRLVKGAYQEPPEIAFPKKSEVDTAYLVCARLMLERAKQGVVGYVPAFATHDVAIIRQI